MKHLFIIGFLLFLAGCNSTSMTPLPSLDSTTPTPTPTPAATPTPTPTPSVACATDFVKIPANAALGTSEFCLSKYEMKLKLNDGTPVFDGNNGGVPVDPALYMPESRPSGIPWVRVSHTTAASECASLGTGYHLVTAKEHQAAARNVESVALNWSGGSVGSGFLYRGHSDGAISATAVADGYAVSGVLLLASGTGSDPYAGTGQSSSDPVGSGGEQRRTYTLTNGEVLWDLSGNARDKVDADGSLGTLSYTGPGSSSYLETGDAAFTAMLSSLVSTNAVNFALNLFAPATSGLTNTSNYVGRYYVSSNARSGKVFSRGGNFDATKAGLFSGDFDDTDSTSSSSGGFRCAK